MSNLANFVTIPFAASAADSIPMEMKMDPGWGNLLNIKVESLDDSVDIVFKVQGKETAGASYTDISGTALTVKPRGAAAEAVSVGPFWQFVVSGGYGRIIISLDSPRAQDVLPM